ncbi:MAG TPA: hypothetical protein VF275_06895 [Gammaproteobacteria bacterium]
MRISIKEAGFAIFFLIVIALVAVEAAERHGSERGGTTVEQPRAS